MRNGGLSGVWLGMVCTIACSCLWAVLIYTSRSWRTISDDIIARAATDAGSVAMATLPHTAPSEDAEQRGALLAAGGDDDDDGTGL